MLTPRELLMFIAQFKLNDLCYIEKKLRVEYIIESLSLENCCDTRVGDVLERKLSGGECKRVCIGLELISNPYILFLDEPTTGLDVHSAEMVLNLLKD